MHRGNAPSHTHLIELARIRQEVSSAGRRPRFISAARLQTCMSARIMRFLRTLHLYLGCLFAPILIFFAVSGSWQLFNWHESTRDHTYTAPRALAVLSDIHKDAHIPPTPNRRPTPL